MAHTRTAKLHPSKLQRLAYLSIMGAVKSPPIATMKNLLFKSFH